MKEKLNDEQLSAVTSTEGFVRVVAGAGSGKTRALACRFAFLVNELGVLPQHILCVTFTSKAANEMRRRLHSLVGDCDTAYVNTFHGFCVSVLQEESNAVGYPRSFLVLDNSDIDAMLRLIYEERGLTMRDMTFAGARDMIEIQKLFKKPDYYRDLIDLSPDALREKYLRADSPDEIIFYGYLCQSRKCFALDYNDLLLFALHIFEQHPSIRLKWQKRLEYIMIDEFQDIDEPQHRLMRVLCDYHKNLFVVGDPDQTIYSWRGANGRFMLDFDKLFQPTKTVMMLKNYRSSPQVIAAANSLISKNQHRIPKELVPVRPSGEAVRFFFADDARKEAKWISDEVKKLIRSGVEARRIAILYRAHYVTRSLEEVFPPEKLPYRIYSGVRFFDRAEIKDALCYLRMLSTRDDLAFRRVANTPKRNIGRRRMEFLEAYAEEHGCTLYQALEKNLDEEPLRGSRAREFVELVETLSAESGDRPVSELLELALARSGYEKMLRTEGSQERLDNLAELKQAVHEYEISCGEEATLAHFLAYVATFAEADASDPADKVKLMTVHAAKGLEFRHVFLCGMNEGVFPSRKIRDLAGMEEERRLAFVAMTRAEDLLTITGAAGRNFDGSPRYPSRFVLNIDRRFVEYVQPPPDSLIADALTYALDHEKHLPENLKNTLFPPGTRVRHDYLGYGEITEADMELNAYMVKFDALPTPRAIAFRAGLKKLE